MEITEQKIDRKDKNNIFDKMAIIFFENNLNVDFFIETKKNIAKYKHIIGIIIKPALEQGRVIWKKECKN